MSTPTPSYTHGQPVWHHIPALSVPRAKEFYSKLLNLQYRPSKSLEEGESIAHFMFDNDTLTKAVIGGGIMKVKAGEKIAELYTKKEGEGEIAPTMYYYVDDLDRVLGEVEGWGGSVLTDKEGDGGMGKHVVVQDTEGNAVGLYGMEKEEGDTKA